MQAFDSTDSDLQFRSCFFTRYKPDRTSLRIEINNTWLTMASLLAVGGTAMLFNSDLDHLHRVTARTPAATPLLDSGCSGCAAVVDNGPMAVQMVALMPPPRTEVEFLTMTMPSDVQFRRGNFRSFTECAEEIRCKSGLLLDFLLRKLVSPPRAMGGQDNREV